MKRPAVFFDRDNTLIANDGYLGDPAGVALIAGAAEAVARVRAMGFAAVTFSNQSGVARGLFTEEAVHAVNSRLDEMLHDQNPRAVFDRHEFCPYHPQGAVERYRRESDLRKPQPGMIFQAAERLGLDLLQSWVIGDAPRDIEAGKTAQCRTILFKDPALKASPAAGEASDVAPDFVAASLAEAVDIIQRNTMNHPDSDSSAPTADAENDSSTGNSTDAESASEMTIPQLPGRKMTFAERVKAGTFQPARGVAGTTGVIERSKRAVNPMVAAATVPATSVDPIAPAASTPPAETAPQVAPTVQAMPTVRATEPLSQGEQIEPLLQQILDELRLLRQRQPYSEFSVTKLLAGIMQVLVMPALFFAYLHRDNSQDFQSMLMLATVLQTITISLLIMGRQS